MKIRKGFHDRSTFKYIDVWRLPKVLNADVGAPTSPSVSALKASRRWTSPRGANPIRFAAKWWAKNGGSEGRVVGSTRHHAGPFTKEPRLYDV